MEWWGLFEAHITVLAKADIRIYLWEGSCPFVILVNSEEMGYRIGAMSVWIN